MTDAKDENFIFVCPNENEIFESSNIKIFDNKGVTTDDAGNKEKGDKFIFLHLRLPYRISSDF